MVSRWHSAYLQERTAAMGITTKELAQQLGLSDCPTPSTNFLKEYMGAMAVTRLAERMTAKHFELIKLEVQTNLMKRQSV